MAAPMANGKTLEELIAEGGPISRRRDCHFDDTPFSSRLKYLLHVEGGAAE